MNLPLPGPVFMITVTRGGYRAQRVTVQALRFLLWVVPALAVEMTLILAGHGRHSVLLTMAAAYATAALAVLLVNAQPEPDAEPENGDDQ